jgi:hypothetical protein
MIGETLALFPDLPAAPRATAPRSAAPAELADPVVEIRTSTRRRKTIAAHWEGETIVVVVPQRLPVRERQQYAAELSARLLADRARQRPTDDGLSARARELSERYLEGRAAPTSVTWSSRQRGRWGSCSPATGTIRISDQLKGVPSWVLDTVLLHELAHLLRPQHDAEFHELANRHPRMAESDIFLAGYALGLRAGEPAR